jgi:hypothetical protein
MRPFYSELYAYGLLRYVPNAAAGPFDFASLPAAFVAPEAGKDPVAAPVDFTNRTVFSDHDMQFEYRYRPLPSAVRAPPASRRIELRTGVAWNTNPGSPLEWWTTNAKSYVRPQTPFLFQHLLGQPRQPGRAPAPPPSPTSEGLVLESLLLDLALDEVVEVVMVSYSGQQHAWQYVPKKRKEKEKKKRKKTEQRKPASQQKIK